MAEGGAAQKLARPEGGHSVWGCEARAAQSDDRGVHVSGLLPIMWSTGTGSDVMKRIAAPMIGGIFTSFILELVVYPAIYAVWKWNFEVKPSLR